MNAPYRLIVQDPALHPVQNTHITVHSLDSAFIVNRSLLMEEWFGAEARRRA